MIRSRSKWTSSPHIFIALLAAIVLSMPSIANSAEHEIDFTADTTLTILALPHTNIFEGSIQLTDSSGKILDLQFERADYNRGIFYLAQPLTLISGSILRYRYLGYDLPEYFFRRKLELERGQTEVVYRQPEEDLYAKSKSDVGGESFLLTGSKSISVSAGNAQDFDLDQTLNIQIQGEPVEGLTLTGSLSDRARPQVAGLSSSLEDIESISVEARARHFRALLGDMDYTNDWGGISSFTKRLKGADAELNLNAFNGRATVAGIKGRFRSVSFFARDGISGPYSLKTPTGARTSIVSGTEKVYLDGRLVTAGASADYVIDYALGEITFNPRIKLNSRSRIVVDYEFLDQSYRRNYYGGEVGFNSSTGGLKTSFGYLEIGDSKENPVNTILSDTDREILEDAGDDRNQAVRDGARFVGEGQGRYVLDTDSLGNEYYRFAGDSLGDYEVSYSRVDQGTGDYVYTGNGIYIYRGPGRGNYLPFEFIPVPSRTRAMYGAASGGIGNLFNFNIKASGSSNDENLFSPLDDENNEGFMAEAVASIIPKDTSDSNGMIRHAQTDLRMTMQERSFSLPGRSLQVELDRKWALNQDTIFKRSDQFEISQRLGLTDIFNFGGLLGRYRDGGYVRADRNLLSIDIQPTRELIFAFKRDDRSSDFEARDLPSRLYQNSLSGNYSFKNVKITAGWEDEKDTRTDTLGGISFDQYYAHSSYAGFSAGISHKQQSRLDSVWRDDFEDFVIEAGMQRSFLNGNIRTESEIVRREVEYAEGRLPNLTETKSLSRINFKGPKNIFSGYLSYRFSRQLVNRLARNFIKVEDGQGDYRLEDSIFVRDPFGDYIAVDELVETGAAGLSSEKSMNLRFDFLKIITALKDLSQLNSETHINLEERGDNSYRLNLLYPLPFWETYPDNPIFSRFDLRQTFNIGTSRGDIISLGFEESKIIDRIRDLQSDRYQRIIFEKVFVNVDQNMNFRLEHRFKRERETSGYFGSADFGEHDILSELTFFSGRQFELSFRPRYLHDYSKADDLTVNMYGARVSSAFGVAGQGRLSADFAYNRVESSEDGFIPYQFAAGNRPGDNFNWSASFNFKYNKYITAQLKYSADKIPGLQTRHRGTLSMRANF
ncbi:MAG: hypothetical protein GWN76_19355 [candidate division Zixibacteria bacterium]|nr:hypothetical protein [candidate division Zixibacteria bacterium]NIS18004.1 hypothetical protein [candidate division Zixibacteria bacterium]NIS47985.1 hypothetical protein [candidate division Zixibacteria bacterium]NIU16093.1 hypothetical protein [candidate division Zixibacteria bacterium]NIW42793.1 hypothetical protein [candidate division Zixibacteria bacterium]